MVIAFFTRRTFLDILGADFIGYTATTQSLLGFLNLAELGISTAIAYILYKPLFNDDKDKINEIISVFGYLYRIIGYIILTLGVLISFFIPLIFPDISFSYTVCYIGYYAYLFSSLLGYFVNYKQTLLSADQRNYEITGYYQIVISAKTLLQMIFVIYFKSMILYLILEILFGAIYSIILSRRVNIIYPWLTAEVKLGHKIFKKYPEIVKYIKQLFAHKLGSYVQFQMIPILIYSYVSLPVVAMYNNYTMISQRLSFLVSSVMDSTSAGIGNLVSERNDEKIYDVYCQLFSARVLISSLFTLNFYYLINPFIEIWVGQEYILENIIVFIVSGLLFLQMCRGTTDQFINAYGLFSDVWAPLVEVLIFLTLAISLGGFLGLTGVLLGPLVSIIVIVYFWKPYFLYSRGFSRPFKQYLKLFLVNIIPLGVTYCVSENLSPHLTFHIASYSWVNWVINALVYLFVSTIQLIIYGYILSPDLRKFIKRLITHYAR